MNFKTMNFDTLSFNPEFQTRLRSFLEPSL